jgi:hypothetical protein
MALETEIARYNELLPELLGTSLGKYVAIKGDDFVGVFDDMDEGYRAVLNKYGVTNFLLRPVRAFEPIWDMRYVPARAIRVEGKLVSMEMRGVPQRSIRGDRVDPSLKK